MRNPSFSLPKPHYGGLFLALCINQGMQELIVYLLLGADRRNSAVREDS